MGLDPLGGLRAVSAHDELLEVQEVEGLRDRIIQEESDWRQAICMHHGSQGAGAALVGLHRRGREQGPVELPDLEDSIWVRVFPLLQVCRGRCWSGASRCTPYSTSLLPPCDPAELRASCGRRLQAGKCRPEALP